MCRRVTANLDVNDAFYRSHWLQVHSDQLGQVLLASSLCWQVQSSAQDLAPASRSRTEVHDIVHPCTDPRWLSMQLGDGAKVTLRAC